MIIPEQLRKNDFRFVLVRSNDKKPFENEWSTTNNYPWYHEKIKTHNGNMGILCGNGLVIFDCDNVYGERLARQLPSTLVIGSSMKNENFRGKHFYFYCPIKKTIILNDYNTHIGEIRAGEEENKRVQTLIPPSIHPSGIQYEILENHPIATVSEEKLRKVISPFAIKSKKEGQKRTDMYIDEKDPAIKVIKSKIRVTDVMRKYGFDLSKNPTNCLWHKSDGGQCFAYNDDTWHCFHCELAGNIFHLVMTHENVDFNEAKIKLAKMSNVDLSKFEKKEKEKIIEKSFLNHGDKIYEQIWDQENGSRYAVWDGQTVDYVESVMNKGIKYIPIQDNKALSDGIVLLPEKPEEYGNTQNLITEIKNHIHKWLDVSEDFEIIATYSIPFYWLYDKFNVVHYLRFFGDSGCGKSRGLDTIGRLSYKPTVISGALTVAPIFRLMDRWNGTLVIDEADMKDSSAQSDIITIFNCGFEKGRPVVRCEKENPDNVQTFKVYGPKIMATRFEFYDKALESRCLTETMKETNRNDIHDLIDDSFYQEEKSIRNKLLMYRFRNYWKVDPKKSENIPIPRVERRIRQITRGVLATLDDETTIYRFIKYIKNFNKKMVEMRSITREGKILNAIFEIHDNNPREFISSSMISEKITEIYNIKNEKMIIRPGNVGRYLKTLHINAKLRRVGNSKRPARVIDWDENLMVKLREKYVVTDVTDVTVVTGTSSKLKLNFYNNNNSGKSKNQGVNDTTVTSVTSVTQNTTKKPEFVLKLLDTYNKISEIVENWKKEYGNESENEFEKVIDNLLSEGRIYEPTPGVIKKI